MCAIFSVGKCLRHCHDIISGTARLEKLAGPQGYALIQTHMKQFLVNMATMVRATMYVGAVEVYKHVKCGS